MLSKRLWGRPTNTTIGVLFRLVWLKVDGLHWFRWALLPFPGEAHLFFPKRPMNTVNTTLSLDGVRLPTPWIDGEPGKAWGPTCGAADGGQPAPQHLSCGPCAVGDIRPELREKRAAEGCGMCQSQPQVLGLVYGSCMILVLLETLWWTSD